MVYVAPVTNHRESRERAARAYYMRHIQRLSWSAIRDALGFQSITGAQNAVRREEKRNPPKTADGALRSADETLNYLLSGIVGQFGRAVARRDDETAAMLADKGRALIAEQTKMHGAYRPQPTADQNVNVLVETTPDQISAAWLRQVQTAAEAAAMNGGGQPAALSAGVIDAEVVSDR